MPALIGLVLFAPVSALHKSLRPVLYLSAWCTVYKYLSALCTTCATVHIVFANPLTSLEVAPGPFFWLGPICWCVIENVHCFCPQYFHLYALVCTCMHFTHHRYTFLLACRKYIHTIAAAYQFNEKAHSLNYFFGEFLCASLSPQLFCYIC